MGSRTQLSAILREILGSNNVYFQPPETVKMNYPCIVYKREPDHTKRADDMVYYRKRKYTLTVIDKNPDSVIPDAISELSLCSFDRVFAADNLNHYAFTIYY